MQGLLRSAQRVATPLAASVAVIAGVSFYGLAHHDVIYALALKPRQADGLLGIATMPLVHGSLAHLAVNTSLYVVFAATLLFRGRGYFALTTTVILVASGILLWLVGRPGAHIGMSMLLFGYFGLLAARGAFERRFSSILVALVKLGNLATIEAQAGAIFFGAVVVITMFAAMTFDPRLIWDNLEPSND